MFSAVYGRKGSKASMYCSRHGHICKQERPYNHDSTASRLLSEVKHGLAGLVLRWGTTLEYPVLFFSFSPLMPSIVLFSASNPAQLIPYSIPYRYFGLSSLQKSDLPHVCASFSLMSNLRNYSQSSISGMDTVWWGCMYIVANVGEASYEKETDAWYRPTSKWSILEGPL